MSFYLFFSTKSKKFFAKGGFFNSFKKINFHVIISFDFIPSKKLKIDAIKNSFFIDISNFEQCVNSKIWRHHLPILVVSEDVRKWLLVLRTGAEGDGDNLGCLPASGSRGCAAAVPVKDLEAELEADEE